MVEVEIAKMSTKGQIVIPQRFRIGIDEGDRFLVFRNGEQIILKRASKLDEQLAEDIEFANRTEQAWKALEEGKGKKTSLQDFLEEMTSW